MNGKKVGDNGVRWQPDVLIGLVEFDYREIAHALERYVKSVSGSHSFWEEGWGLWWEGTRGRGVGGVGLWQGKRRGVEGRN